MKPPAPIVQPALTWRRHSQPPSAAAGTTCTLQLPPAAPSPPVPPCTGATAAAAPAAATAAAVRPATAMSQPTLPQRLSTTHQMDRRLSLITSSSCTSGNRTRSRSSPRSSGNRRSRCPCGRSRTRGTAAATTAPSPSTPQHWPSGSRSVGDSWQTAVTACLTARSAARCFPVDCVPDGMLAAHAYIICIYIQRYTQ